MAVAFSRSGSSSEPDSVNRDFQAQESNGKDRTPKSQIDRMIRLSGTQV